MIKLLSILLLITIIRSYKSNLKSLIKSNDTFNNTISLLSHTMDIMKNKNDELKNEITNHKNKINYLTSL
jgi:uncharacterized coiled-coil DUF342 family protein